MSQFMKKSEVMDVRAAVEALQTAVIEGRKEIWEQQMKRIDQEVDSGKSDVTSGDQELASAKLGADLADREAASAKQGVMSADRKVASSKQGVMSAEQGVRSAKEEEQLRQQSGQGQSEGEARAQEDLQGCDEERKGGEIGRNGGEAHSEPQKGPQQKGPISDQKRGESGEEHKESGAQENDSQEATEGGRTNETLAGKYNAVTGSLNGVQGKASERGEGKENDRWGDSDEEAVSYEAGRKRAGADYGNGEDVNRQEEAENVRHAKEDEKEKGQAGEVATRAEENRNGGGGKGDTGEGQRESEEGGERGGIKKEKQGGASESEDEKHIKAGLAKDEGSAEGKKEEEEEVEKEKELFGCGVAEIYRTDEPGAGRSGRTDVGGAPDLSEEWLKGPTTGNGAGAQEMQAERGKKEGPESGTWERTAQALNHGWSGRPRLTVTEILEEPAEPGFAESERAKKGKAKVDDGSGNVVTTGTPVSDDDVTRLAWQRTEQLINERWGATGPEYFNPGMTPGGESAASQIAEMAEQAQVVQVSKLGEGLMTAVKTVLGGTRDAVLGWKERIEDAVGGSPRSPVAGDARGLGVLGDGVDAALEKTSEGGVNATDISAGGYQESACNAIGDPIAGDCGSGGSFRAEGKGKGLTIGSAANAGSGEGRVEERRSTAAGAKHGKADETGYVALDEIEA
ncbi:hypothetical protein KFL_015530020 [Klebsormidium nitens]|uniref:Uncharacterized protein n=1 Tax=Klebsormidium nitens TaxID=105231 RepID=A0A1Y1IXI1_KLENI|nr:hypothetical protein KFL_015530020 [Klebsormidium nitens]|eukprot:GAQ93467.1 hypothetical protein KFL_015530020 [Klebsormidium nitens]